METNPVKIIDNILGEMAEIGDWSTICDAIQANGRRAHLASREDIMSILVAIKESPDVSIGRLDGEFQDLPPDWEPSEVTAEIFSDPQPDGAMMEVLIRPTGAWPQPVEL